MDSMLETAFSVSNERAWWGGKVLGGAQANATESACSWKPCTGKRVKGSRSRIF